MARLEARKKRFGPLEALHIEAGAADGPTVVLFHGFGADMHDLASLAGAVQVPKGTNWLFPNGHLSVELGPHQMGRAWFPVTLGASAPLDWSAQVPPGLKRATEGALEMIQKLAVPTERLVLGGFSQGAMLATEVTLNLHQANKATAGLAILSGTLINEAKWSESAKKTPGFPFFQCHGTHDPILSLALAERLERMLLASGWSGRLLRFSGGHEIPPEALIQLGSYLRARLPQ